MKAGAIETPAFVASITNALRESADGSKAGPMAAYMKHHFPFFGVPKPARVAATKHLVRSLDDAGRSAIEKAVRALWMQPEREHHYVALDILERHRSRLGAAALPFLRGLVSTNSWWDSVDGLAPIVGAGVVQHRAWADEMLRWARDPNTWIRRVAIIHQLRAGDDVDRDRLVTIVLANASDPELFIRKAIGWALRTLAWSDPEFVERFVEEHRDVLSPLSTREALKNLRRGVG